MNDNFLVILKQIVAEQDEGILSNPRRVSAFFADLARDIPKPQKNAFVKCLERQAAQILKNAAEPDRETCKQRLAQKLHEEEGLDLGLCGEAIELLAAVLFEEKQKKENLAKCANCGKELQEGGKVCPYCSAPVAETNKGSDDKIASTQAAKTEEKNTVFDDVKFRILFDAYVQNKIPFAEGYIISSFYSETSTYSIFEVVSYTGVKEIYPTAGGLTFVAGGKKLYILLEPDTYHQKFIEPVSRSKTDGEYIPQRFRELETIITKNQTRIMVAKEPIDITSSFTILEPKGINFSVVFYDTPEISSTFYAFFQESINCREVPEQDAKKAAKLIASTIEKTMSIIGKFQ
jgi:hypothetical protein